MLRAELANILSVLGHLFKTLFDHSAEKAFGLDQRHLHVAVAVAVKAELQGDIFGE